MSSFAVPAKPTKSLTTSELEERLTRHRNLQNGMEHILGKLKHDAKGVTIDDAQRLADNAEDGDEWTASIIDAVEDLALRNEDEQAVTPHPASEISNVPQDIIERLRSDPSSITEEDARRFSETVEARDERSARLVSAVESLAAAHNDIYSKDSSLSQSPHPFLLTVVKDLYAAVEANPEDIDAEILRTTQSIVSKMQKAIGHTNAPHPELEAELQQEYAKIVPKVECGVVTKAEADHLHSLEARAHGHTERGGLTAQAQSVAARCERQTSFSSGSGNLRSRANSRSFPPHKQALHDTGSETSGVEPKDQRSPERSGVAPSNTSVRRLQSLSESTNTARGDGRYDAAFPKLQAYGSFERGSGGSENMPRTQKHESGQQGR